MGFCILIESRPFIWFGNSNEKKIQSLNSESINNDKESNQRHYKRIKVEDRFNLKSKLNSCENNKIINNETNQHYYFH